MPKETTITTTKPRTTTAITTPKLAPPSPKQTTT